MKAGEVLLSGADPVPARLRQNLERCRKEGLDFVAAWSRVVQEIRPLPPGWERKPHPAECESSWERLSPLEFARHFFCRAYAHLDLGMGLDFAECHHYAREHLRSRPAFPVARCMSGDGLRSGSTCPNEPVPGKRFCEFHAAQLARVRRQLSTVAAASKSHAQAATI